ncbi:MAG: DUF4920 domain-containing protein [Gemmatimonadetes bacterium]|nr:DUF4920 domain-containing protein [Gemmatimonadota bacterium]
MPVHHHHHEHRPNRCLDARPCRADCQHRDRPVEGFRQGADAQDATPISSILKDPAAWDGKRVLVEGLIIEVCEERGCWIRIASDKAFESLRFKVEDGVMTFPMEAKGKTVLAEGVVKVKSLTREQAVAQAREVAKERGTLASFDPAKVKGPVTDVQLSGEGARVK